MRRAVQISVDRVLWLCFMSAVIGADLVVVLWQAKRGESIIFPILGITGVVLVLVMSVPTSSTPTSARGANEPSPPN